MTLVNFNVGSSLAGGALALPSPASDGGVGIRAVSGSWCQWCQLMLLHFILKSLPSQVWDGMGVGGGGILTSSPFRDMPVQSSSLSRRTSTFLATLAYCT